MHFEGIVALNTARRYSIQIYIYIYIREDVRKLQIFLNFTYTISSNVPGIIFRSLLDLHVVMLTVSLEMLCTGGDRPGLRAPGKAFPWLTVKET